MSDQDEVNQAADGPQEEDRKRVPLPPNWSSAIEDLIDEARRDGLFDNLSGQGKPLQLSGNPDAAGTELAYQLLKNNDYTLPWIAERNDVLAMIDELRQAIGRAWLRHQAEYLASHSETAQLGLSLSWIEHLDRWRVQIGKLNRRITSVNLKQPSQQLEIYKLSLKGELDRAGAAESLG